ncbi:MAG: hypothetical protein HZA93_21525 [Verrucomicrobia bacterium]|nr:hypothetical protein [Verrucomicrobiota bacterium]
MRVAAGTELGPLVTDYDAGLRGRELSPKRVRDPSTWVRRMTAGQAAGSRVVSRPARKSGPIYFDAVL